MFRKVIIVIAAVVAVESARVSLKDGLMLMECKSGRNVPSSDLRLMEEHKLPETRDGKCMMGCLLRKMKFLTRNGRLDLANARKWVADTYKNDATKREIGFAVTDECAKRTPKQGSNECDATVELFNCVKTATAQIKKKRAG